MECNFNPMRKTYNPHFHIITKDKETAEVLLSEWPNLWTSKFAKRPAQNIQKVDDLESGLIEIIKHRSKIFTEPDLKNQKNKKDTAQIYIKALNTILAAMKGKRIFDRFGFNSPNENKPQQYPKLHWNFKEWIYDPENSDWIDTVTGEVFADYKMPSHLQAILDNNINNITN